MHRRRVVRERIRYIGLDVHKEGIVVAIAEGGIGGEVCEYGRIANTAAGLDRLMRKLGGAGVRLRFCYEAGPCGYGIQRHLSAHGHDCVVVAPSLIPKRAGDRIKTDRRDAAGLARLHRAGELTTVWVPDVGHEAMRDLVRARLDAVHALRRARQQLSGFLLRQGCHYGRPAWTKLHRPHGTSPWAEGSRLAGLRFEQAVHHIVLEDYIAAVAAAGARRDRLTAQIEAMLPDWTLAPIVAALQTLRGMGWSRGCVARSRRMMRALNERQPRGAGVEDRHPRRPLSGRGAQRPTGLFRHDGDHRRPCTGARRFTCDLGDGKRRCRSAGLDVAETSGPAPTGQSRALRSIADEVAVYEVP
jgi:transposase